MSAVTILQLKKILNHKLKIIKALPSYHLVCVDTNESCIKYENTQSPNCKQMSESSNFDSRNWL